MSWHDREIGEQLMLNPLLLGLHRNTAGFSPTHRQQTKKQVAQKDDIPTHERASPRLLHVRVHQRHMLSQTTWLERTLLLLKNWPSHYQATLSWPTGDFTLDCAHPAPTTDMLTGSTPDLPTLFPKDSLSISVKSHHNSKWMNPRVTL